MDLQPILDFVLPHWPGFTWAVVAMLIGQVMAGNILTKEAAFKKGKYQWVFWWGRKTLPLHPVLAGFALGFVWRNPEGADPAWPLVGSMMYFGFFGAISTWLYEALRSLLQKRGIELDLPGDSEPPPPPSAPEPAPAPEPPQEDPTGGEPNA